MLKLSNKGFAISVMLYGLTVLAIGIMYLLLNVVSSRYKMSNSLKNSITDTINAQGLVDKDNELAYITLINSNNLITDGNSNRRYVGSNPNNYIYFNGGEYWRIIGIFDINDNMYIKIINTEAVAYNLNELNTTYYQTFANSSKEQISSINWYQPNISSSLNAKSSYDAEQSSSSVINNVGVIYQSDYGYAADKSYWNTLLSNYQTSINDNWLFLNNNYYTMSNNGTNYNIVTPFGNLESNSINSNYLVYPVVYLKTNVLIQSGDGSRGTPYTLA